MVILPAIDIKGGQCVRLFRGDMSTAKQVASDPLEAARGFEQAGAKWLHTVDLDGAVSGKRVNADIFISLAKNTNLKVELGGGIRTMEDIDFYLSNGIERVILGSVALKDPELVRQAVEKYGERIAVGIDAKNGKVAAEGWIKDSEIDYIDLAKQMEQIGVKVIIYTDISKDGTLMHPNFEQLGNINSAVSCNIIASGGVTDIDDIKLLNKMGMYGTICGKAIYNGNLDLVQAIAEGNK